MSTADIMIVMAPFFVLITSMIIVFTIAYIKGI